MVARSVEKIGLNVHSNDVVNRVLQGFVFAYQAMAVVVFVLGIFYANNWLQTPFLGAFYEHTLVFTQTKSNVGDVAWSFSKNVKSGDQIIAINDEPVASDIDIREILSTRSAGEFVKVSVLLKEGNVQDFDVTLYEFPTESRAAYLYFPMVLSGIFLLLSFWIFGFRRNESAGRAFSLFTSSLAIITGAFF
ncbi:MAG: hypothetical protein UZ14_CFX002000369 [Chloroflexi bacterium OLB14]|nr:MAG: hypothetical protein UZ14_CFX002000369 [Chloroflexi bacterium OLB14]